MYVERTLLTYLHACLQMPYQLTIIEQYDYITLSLDGRAILHSVQSQFSVPNIIVRPSGVGALFDTVSYHLIRHCM